MKALFLSLLIFLVPAAVAEAQLFGKSPEKRIAGINEMRSKALAELYDQRPQVKRELEGATGYAVFSNVGVQIALVNAGGGTGVAHHNRLGKDTYMKMGTAGIGIGLGIKDFRAVFVFHDDEVFQKFIDQGWDFSGQADAAAQIDDIGDERSEVGTARRRVSIYQFTENGIALQASLNGTRYWKDTTLNTHASGEPEGQ